MEIRVIDEGPLYRVTSAVGFSVTLKAIDGEEGRFHAFSDTRYHCHACHHRFTSKERKPCPKCEQAAEPVCYIVDVVSNGGRGRCSCENFTCNKMDSQEPDSWQSCKHVFAAFVLFGHFMAVEIAERIRLAKLQPPPRPVPPPPRPAIQSIAESIANPQ